MNTPNDAVAIALPLSSRIPSLGAQKELGPIGIYPAFKDMNSGETHLSVRPDGSIASIHLLEGLPDHWIIARNPHGRVTALKDTVVAGYFRDGHFFSYSEWQQRRPDA
jgi:hypothetical protein